VSNEDWRVEINLDDEHEGYDIGERLRSQDLDDDVRARLGKRVYVSRNGSQLFLYAGSEQQAREAESVVRELVETDNLTAEFAGVTRWHPVEQEWKDASIPLPRTETEIHQELERREEAERREVAEKGSYDWLVKINLPSAADAEQIADTLNAAGHRVHRIWRWVTVDVLTEEIGNDLIASVQETLPADAEIWLEGNLDDRDAQSPTAALFDPRMY
jgi:hypothetical protein